jgi:hypothetical protein
LAIWPTQTTKTQPRNTVKTYRLTFSRAALLSLSLVLAASTVSNAIGNFRQAFHWHSDWSDFEGTMNGFAYVILEGLASAMLFLRALKRE